MITTHICFTIVITTDVIVHTISSLISQQSSFIIIVVINNIIKIIIIFLPQNQEAMVVSKGISRKRKFALVLFLIIVTLVVLYSYCYGKSICYTMPLFTDWSRVTVSENKHGYVLTSSVHLKAETSNKPGSYKEKTSEKSRPTHGKGNATIHSWIPGNFSSSMFLKDKKNDIVLF